MQNEQVAVRKRAIELICIEADEMGYLDTTIAEFRAGNFDGDDLLTLQAVERALEASQAEAGKRALARCIETIRNHERAGNLEGLPGIVAIADVLADLTTPTRIEAAQVDVDANRKVALRNLEKSGLRAPQAAQPQEAVAHARRFADWNDKELAGIADLSAATGMSEMAVIRQALRLYQQHHSRIMAGETVHWSGDEQRAKDFAGPLYTPPQAAESGLLEQEELSSFVETWLMNRLGLDNPDDLEEYREFAILLDFCEALSAKAGKPGEAGNG